MGSLNRKLSFRLPSAGLQSALLPLVRLLVVQFQPKKTAKNGLPRRKLRQVVSTAMAAPDWQRFIPSPTPQVALGPMQVISATGR